MAPVTDAEAPSRYELAIAASVLVAVIGGLALLLLSAGKPNDDRLADNENLAEVVMPPPQDGDDFAPIDADQAATEKRFAVQVAELQRLRARFATERSEFEGQLSEFSPEVRAARSKILEEYVAKTAELSDLVTYVGDQQVVLENLRTENLSMRDDISKARGEIDHEFNALRVASEQNHGAKGELIRLEERRKQLLEELENAERVLAANNLTKDLSIADVPPEIDGLITRVQKHNDDIYVELTVGSDDGIRMGHTMEVYRDGKYLGPVEIVRTTPDRAVAKVDRRRQRGEIHPKDRVEAIRALRLDAVNEPPQPEASNDLYVRIRDNPFFRPLDAPLSIFSIDVDTASYANIRQFLIGQQQLPPADAVRVEELVNYFDYTYPPPKADVPFAAHLEVAACPWQPEHRLARIALKGKEVDTRQRPPCNLVFLLDVSGSMQDDAKLPLVIEGMKLLVEQLKGDDRVAIVVYAGAEGLALESTAISQKDRIIEVLERLQSGGSTNGGAGITLAYKVAEQQFLPEGINRVILCTDGDFNVGVTNDGALERLVVEKAKSGTYLTVLGFGRGNLNDAMMENISNKGNGNYAYVDNLAEAQRVLVQQGTGTLLTIAKDVKIQVEFNPAEVAAYRLIGYGNRLLDAKDFNDDTKDAGEIGAGHTVTAFYEIVPKQSPQLPDRGRKIDPLKYQKPQGLTPAADSGELFTLRIRYKPPTENESRLLTSSARDNAKPFRDASADFQFASAVASFGMLLRDSDYAGRATYGSVLEIAQNSLAGHEDSYRNEFVDMIKEAERLSGR